jgi:hypothetical protein
MTLNTMTLSKMTYSLKKNSQNTYRILILSKTTHIKMTLNTQLNDTQHKYVQKTYTMKVSMTTLSITRIVVKTLSKKILSIKTLNIVIFTKTANVITTLSATILSIMSNDTQYTGLN